MDREIHDQAIVSDALVDGVDRAPQSREAHLAAAHAP
jgi:hypothetical protein